MTPSTGEALVILVAFVLPGFVAVIVRQRTHELPRKDQSAFELLLRAAYYSALTYIVMAVGASAFGITRADVAELANDPEVSVGRIALVGILAFLVIPSGLAWGGMLWSGSGLRGKALSAFGVRPGHSTESAWDHYFQQQRQALVIVRLVDDGESVAGFLGDQSFAAYPSHGRDLFLEQRWTLVDDWFGQPVDGSQGIWIDGGRIRTIEVYDLPEPATAGESNAESSQSAT